MPKKQRPPRLRRPESEPNLDQLTVRFTVVECVMVFASVPVPVIVMVYVAIGVPAVSVVTETAGEL